MTTRRGWEDLRRAVYAREAGHCLLCAVRLAWDDWECHHRRLKSRQGRNELVNLVAVCHRCHGRIHREPTWSTARGLMVPSWAEPAIVPVYGYDPWTMATSWRLPSPLGGWDISGPLDWQELDDDRGEIRCNELPLTRQPNALGLAPEAS